MVTIAVANRKGGVGKTTIACALATRLGVDHKVLFIDLDSQANATESLDVPAGPGVAVWLLAESLAGVVSVLDGLDLLPGGADTTRVSVDGDKHGLETIWRGLRDASGYDWVILDCPPSLSNITKAAIYSSDWVLCPTVPEYLSVAGVRQLITQVGEMALKHERCKVRIMGIQPNMFDVRTNEHKAHLTDMVKAYGARGYGDGGLVWPPLRRTIAVTEASAAGRPVWEFLSGDILTDWTAMVERVQSYAET